MIFHHSELKKKLIYLNEHFFASGVKTSFEDEGSLFEEVSVLGNLAHECNMNFSVKVGGCEAKTDVLNSIILKADSIVAPMIESSFGLQKWAETIDSLIGKDLMDDYDFFINIESKVAYENLKNILNSEYVNRLSGVVVGRSDFVKSYGLTKENVNDDEVFNSVYDIFTQAKEKNLLTIMGGSISGNSKKFIQNLYKNKLLDRIETRNVIIDLTDENIKIIDDAIECALSFELQWLKSKKKYYSNLGQIYQDRIDVIEKRK